MHTEKTLEEYLDGVHGAATAVSAILEDVEPSIQMAALVKHMGILIYSAVKSGVFPSVDVALEHYGSGIKAMVEDLSCHYNRVKQ